MGFIIEIIEKIKNFFLKISLNSQSEGSETISWWEKILAFFASAFKFSLAFLFIILIGHAIYELFRYDLVIKPFETPFNLSRQGYTGSVVAYRLQHYMDELREELETQSIRPDKGVATIQFSELEKRQEIDVPTIGLSLNAIIVQLRRMLGIKQRRVSGDIVVRHNKLYLTLRITGKPTVTFSGDDDKNPESVIKTAARRVLETFEPLTVGLNYCMNYKNQALSDLIAYHQKSQISDKEIAASFMLEACLLKNQQAYDKALIKLEQAEKHDRKNSALFQIKGDTLQASKKYEASIEAYKRAAKYDPQNGGIYTQWARALIEWANEQKKGTFKNTLLEKAFAQYEKAAKKDSKNPWVYTDWGYQLATVQKHFELADEKFAQAIVIEPQNALAYAMWGDVLLKYRAQAKQASEKYARAVELNPNMIWVYGNLGVALVKQKLYQLAIIQFEIATQLKPLNWIYKEWGNTLFLMERYEAAIVQFKKAMALTPNDWYPYYVLGKTLSQLKRFEEAVIQYQKSLAIKPTFVLGYNRLGYALVQLKKPKQALAQCETVLELKQVNVQAKASTHALCGLALIALNQPKKAIEACQTAHKLDPNAEWLPQCLEKALAKLNNVEDFAQYESFVDSLNNALLKGRYYYAYGNALTKLK
ncbi:MAG: hypothetical protein DRQ49_05175, partial [Gammaproteobacteria bacterium]